MFNNIERGKFQLHALLSNHFLALAISLFFAITAVAQRQEKESAGQFFEQGETLYAQRQWAAAEAAYTRAVQLAPGLAEAYYARAITREKLNRPEAALTDYNIIISLKPQHAEALLSRAVLRYQLLQYDQARQDFEQLLLLPAGETSAVYFRQNPFTGTTDQIFTVRANDRSLLYNYLGLIASAQQQFSAAIVSFDSAIALKPLPDYLVNRGLAHQEAGNKLQAEVDYRQALTLNPGHEVAQYNLAQLHRSSGATAQHNTPDSAVADNATTPYALAARAYSRLQAANWAGALLDYNRALQLDSTNEEYLLNRALVKEKLGDVHGAYTDYTAAITLREDYEQAWLNRGNLLARARRHQEAVEDYTVALLYNPEYGAAYYNRAVAQHHLGNDTMACADLRQAATCGHLVPPAMLKMICK